MSKPTRRHIWVELIKAFGLVWIFTNHITEQLFGGPYIANPSSGWPAMAERISQLRPLNSYGFWNIGINILRYFGWSGDQGVQLFLIASGFGLTWSLLNKQSGKMLNIRSFYLRRAERIMPLWWGVHVFYITLWILTGWGLSFFTRATLLSFIGIRITPGELYYFSPAWWYVGLIIQLYLVYPLLWEGLCKWGPTKLLLWGCIIAFSIRGLGLFVFERYLDAWSRGAIFITRLPEFLFGICLAAWIFSKPEVTSKRMHSPLTLVSVFACYILGTFLSLTLPGMIFAPFCLGASAFLMLYLIIEKLINVLPPQWLKPGIWLGEHSYSIFLVHNPIVLLLIPFGISLSSQLVGRVLFSIFLTLILALFLEYFVLFIIKLLRQTVERYGKIRAFLAGSLLCVLVIGLFISAELLVRRFDPQEVLGWGERPSLQPDPLFGWRLRSSQITHLRWESYDYVVTANSLGFPGPEYPVVKKPGTYRIFVTGDAFSSAEGVNTGQAWPRLLETRLATSGAGKQVEVLNFAITGYGPNQYEAVIQHYVPIYQPDLIILEVFVNDFQDALNHNEAVQNSIGFNQPKQDSIYSIIHLENLRRWSQLTIKDPLKEFLRGQPRPQGYFLGNFKALERGQSKYEIDGKAIVAQRLSQIRSITNDTGAKLLIFMVPAPVQICGENDLDYYPKGVNLQNNDIFDNDLPQRMMAELTTSLYIPFYDLRDDLSTQSETCPYQSQNMHWTIYGHEVVAEIMADLLSDNGYFP